MIYLVLTLLAILTLWIVDYLVNGTRKMRDYNAIPGPPTLPLLGNLHQLPTNRVELFNIARTLAAKYKGIYKFYAPPYRTINIYNPEDIETVLSSPRCNDKSITYKILEPWLKEGLLLSKDEKWHDRRKILTPAFHFNILRHFSHILEENSWRLVDKLRHCDRLDDVDLVPLVSEYTLSSICETAMGTKLDDEQSGAGRRYKSDIYLLTELLMSRFAKVWMINDRVWRLTSNSRKQYKVLKSLSIFPKHIIEDRRKYHDIFGDDLYVKGDEDEEIHMNEKKRMAMLDLLLTAEKQGLIDAAGIQEEVDTFMFEGHDTTAMGLVYTLILLAFHEEVQDKVFAELEVVFGTSDRPARMAELQQLKYLECVIKESLRLYPPVPFISRRLGENVQLSGHQVSAGTICHVHIYDLHRRGDLFDEPLQFRPERFQNERLCHPYAYIPFSAGARNCIGQKLAMLEMKSLISAILRNFRLRALTTPQDLVFTADLVLRTVGPVRVAFHPRK